MSHEPSPNSPTLESPKNPLPSSKSNSNLMSTSIPMILDVQTAGGELVQPFPMFPLHFSHKKHLKVKNKNSDNNQTRQDSNPNHVPEKHVQSEKPAEPESAELEPDVPIANRKGVGAFTQHLISHFVKYDHVSKSVQALISNLSSKATWRTKKQAVVARSTAEAELKSVARGIWEAR